jgi:hypothetical protein
MLDVEAVVAPEVGAQRLRLRLGPGVEILVVEDRGLARPRRIPDVV